jgi:hypothetical protein
VSLKCKKIFLGPKKRNYQRKKKELKNLIKEIENKTKENIKENK